MLEERATCCCGKELLLGSELNEWVWFPRDGSPRIVTDHPDGLVDVYGYLGDLKARILAGGATPREECHYSDLSAQVSLLCGLPHPFTRTQGLHVHRAPFVWSGSVPNHHGEPMWYRPDGWHCRVAHQHPGHPGPTPHGQVR